MIYQLPVSALYIFNHVFVQKCDEGFAIACTGASLRSVNIRRHRSPTRAIIAAFSDKAYRTFVVHALSHFHDYPVPNVPSLISDSLVANFPGFAAIKPATAGIPVAIWS
jgi:hypothetical protein